MELGPYLAFDGINYECALCERDFASEGSLYAHCRNTSQHDWCERHNICLRCPSSQDFETHAELDDHLMGSHHFCSDCNLYHESAEKLREHDIDKHHLCVKCERYFATKNNLEMHQQKHQARTMECCGCYKTFKSFSGVLIHLESGSCPSNITEEEIDEIAHECYQNRKYTNEGLEDGGWLYKCPHCEIEFSKLSGLYQHAEDVPSCSFLIKGYGCLAKLERFIARSLG
ncbi:hypothetical protein P170DRAFT_410888 [Aspergillus steynii IBT 23096]|uniref:C2H2-type domain-containing protein n=1 Tax=Aspergillus steynii IBT 23096 TaxID=1392250 RepID=A0A2I2G5N1_9EURO|nr:uncharacterized protein P170DRAFT_410888 [Aspergillus steynii IBT 23096]PLB48185.1 hypothetical protein P170DRAFT_410888 [Aspergillus steynii IBT 23096]